MAKPSRDTIKTNKSTSPFHSLIYVAVLIVWSVFMIVFLISASSNNVFLRQAQQDGRRTTASSAESSSSVPSSLSSSSSKNDINIVQTRRITPLDELVGSKMAGDNITCEGGAVPVYDRLLDPSLAYKRKIPRIIHMTSKSRCLHPELNANVEKWRKGLPNHSLFFHDDEAMDKLLHRDWPEFPNLKYVLQCLLYGGVVKADIWRILVLWEYGGIYTDFDTYPNKFNETTIQDEDDGFFVIESLGTPSQWFMAVSPRHPMMYTTMLSILSNVQGLNDVGDLPIVSTTGPGAVAQGFDKFMGPSYKRPKPVQPGLYTGAMGRSVRLVGTSKDQNEYVSRVVIVLSDQKKQQPYQTMGMAHITHMGSRDKANLKNESCLWRMYKNEMQQALSYEAKW